MSSHKPIYYFNRIILVRSEYLLKGARQIEQKAFLLAHDSRIKGSLKNKLAEFALRFGSDLAIPIESR
jgi:hypothetical protein